MRSRTGQAALGIAVGAVTILGAAPAAHAATRPDASTKTCVTVSARDLHAGENTDSGAASAAAIAIAVHAKARNDVYAAQRPTGAAAAAAAARDTQKEALLRSGQIHNLAAGCAGAVGANMVVHPNTSGQITWMYQYAQTTGYYCGPAVVSEMSATTPGSSPYNLSQSTVASYMGTTTDGTSAGQEVNGLNHFVGVPDFGRTFYGMVWTSDPPTAQQNTDFVNHLAADVAVSSPVAGLAYEVAGGPHLVGHPVNQNIGHWIEIGGYNSSQVWYADSATSVWSSVPTYSWFSTSTMEIILGGAGYIW